MFDGTMMAEFIKTMKEHQKYQEVIAIVYTGIVYGLPQHSDA